MAVIVWLWRQNTIMLSILMNWDSVKSPARSIMKYMQNKEKEKRPNI